MQEEVEVVVASQHRLREAEEDDGDDFPHFFHSTKKQQQVSDRVMILPVIPNPCYEAFAEEWDEVRVIEADQSFDISISFNQLE